MTKIREGVVVVPVDESGNLYCIPPLSENNTKKERVVGDSEELRVFGDDWEFPAGAIELGDGLVFEEALRLGALREAAEEIGMIPSLSKMTKLDYGFVVEQERDGTDVEFNVSVIEWVMTADQLWWIRNVVGAKPAKEIIESTSVKLRPRDAFVYQLFAGQVDWLNLPVVATMQI